FLVGVEVWRRLRSRERLALARADRVIAISNHTLRRFRETNPDIEPRSPIAGCLPGIGPPEGGLYVRSDGRSDVRSGEDGFALIVGRMAANERYKGHDALIDVWPSVCERAPAARLVIAGDGDDRKRLESRVADAGLSSAIRFAGRVPDDDLL